MTFRQELLSGLSRLNATTTVLQRARLADPLRGMWEAADLQWAWRRPRPTDDLALPVWFDDFGPVAAVGLTAVGNLWQADVHAVPATVDEAEVWAAMLAAAAQHPGAELELLVRGVETGLISLALEGGFTMTDELSGTTWLDAAERPPVTTVAGFTIVDRRTRSDRPHPMIARNGETVEARLQQCSLYDLTLDVAVEDADGSVAGYALFWYDPVTQVGLLEPMRVEDAFQRRGLARMLLTNGLDLLARRGARRLKVGFTTEPARQLYLGAGLVQTSVDRRLIRPAEARPELRIYHPGMSSSQEVQSGARDILRAAASVLVIDWPSRDVPEALAGAGFEVYVAGGPETFSAVERVGGKVVTRTVDRLPDRIDLVYAHRPFAELPRILEMAKELGARTIWCQSGILASGGRDPAGCWVPEQESEQARMSVESAGLQYVDEVYIAAAARELGTRT